MQKGQKMIMDIIQSRDYQVIIQEQIYDIIDYLLAHDNEFSITASIQYASFEPQLPQPIMQTFSEYTMFSLMNYTYTTIELTPTHISFEAGFGAENFGSVVTIPLNAIFQIVLEESILYLNPTATVQNLSIDMIEEEDQELDHKAKSMNAFMKNNKDLF